MNHLQLGKVIFSLPGSLHAINLAAVLITVCLTHWEAFVNRLASWAEPYPLGYYGAKDAGIFQPLSVTNWLVHVLIMVFALETLGYFLREHRRLTVTLTNRKDLSQEERKVLIESLYMVKVQFVCNLISHMASFLPLISHGLIHREGYSHLEPKLMDIFFVGMRIHSFTIGIAVWTKHLWACLMVIAYLCWEEILLFHNVGGILLSTWALVITTKRADLPWGFKIGFLGLALSPFFVPDSSYDFGHLLAAASIAGSCAIQSISVNYWELFRDKMHPKSL